jgi:hypothetical protein
MSTKTLVRFEDLRPGDHIAVTERIKVGLKIWYTTVRGTVERTERRRNGLHVARSQDDFAFQDVIVLLKDGQPPEETTISLDEYAVIERC